jgi:hypothetical protein
VTIHKCCNVPVPIGPGRSINSTREKILAKNQLSVQALLPVPGVSLPAPRACPLATRSTCRRSAGHPQRTSYSWPCPDFLRLFCSECEKNGSRPPVRVLHPDLISNRFELCRCRRLLLPQL